MDYLLRPWKWEDIDDVAALADNPRIAANLRNAFVHPYTRADAQAYIESCLQADENAWNRAIEVDGRAVGSIGVFLKGDVYCKSAEIGYWLGEPYWGKGIMSRAVRELCREVFEKTDIVRIFAEPFAYNTGSRRVLEKAGFELEGVLRQSVFKNGRLADSCMYALLR